MGPLTLFSALAPLGLPFAAARPPLRWAYAGALTALGAFALYAGAPERLLLSYKLTLALTLEVSEASPSLGVGLLGAAARSPSPRVWSAAALGLCAALSTSPPFTALFLGLCALGLGGAAAPAAWIAGLSLWAGAWAGEGSAALGLFASAGLLLCAQSGPDARVAALVAAGMFTSADAGLPHAGALGLIAAALVTGLAAWRGSSWLAAVGLGLSLDALGSPGLALCLMVAGLLPDAAPQPSPGPLTAASAALSACALLVLGAGLGPAPAAILPLAVALWAVQTRRPASTPGDVLAPALALTALIWRWGSA